MSGQSVPSPGDSGRLVYAGGNSVKAGQVIAVGQGPATPDGFLGRATSVTTKAGETTVETVPATLSKRCQTDRSTLAFYRSPERHGTGSGKATVLLHRVGLGVLRRRSEFQRVG